MYKASLFLFVLTVSSFVALSQNTIEWEKSFGGNANDYPASVIQTYDGGILIAGTSSSSNGMITGNHGQNDIWIIKLDINKNLLWEKSLGGSQDDYAARVLETNDQDFFVVGGTSSNDGDVSSNHGNADVWLVKLDSVGNILWQKTYGGSGNDEARDILSIGDSAFVISANTYSNDGDITSNHGLSDCWIFKISADGTIDWQKTYGGSSNDETPFIVSSGEGYITASRAVSNDGDVSGNHGQEDIWVTSIDNEGNLKWQRSFGGSEGDIPYSIIQDHDLNYVVAGYSWSNDGDVTDHHGIFPNADCWILKFDSSGNLIWTKSYGGDANQAAVSIIQSSEGEYVLAGSTDPDGDIDCDYKGFVDILVFGLNNGGQPQWQMCLGGSEQDDAGEILQVDSASFLLAGMPYSNDKDVSTNYGGQDFWLVGLNLFTGVEGIFSKDEPMIYPNPSEGVFKISLLNPESFENLDIFNSLGKKIFSVENYPLSLGEIDISSQPNGIYLVQMKTEDGIIVEKLMISK